MPLSSDSASSPLFAPAGPRPVSLGLQGGGAYGAFTWGVLDRLLDDESIVFDGISGTSAGAINAVVMADGMAHGGGRAGAQARRNRSPPPSSIFRAISAMQSAPPGARRPGTR